jgi:hypothetical protein
MSPAVLGWGKSGANTKVARLLWDSMEAGG